MAENSKHTLLVVFEGATDMVLEIAYIDVSSRERAADLLRNLDIPPEYPHHPVWALLGGISGKFAEGVSTAHVTMARKNAPDVFVMVAAKQKMTIQTQHQPA